MLDLNDLAAFVQVVDRNGFSAASRALGAPKSSLSRRVQQLEAALGVRLVQRTSRRFTVTAIGQEIHRHARAMLIEAEAAESVARRRLAEPGGTIRFTCSIGMAQGVVAELVPRFMARFPKVDVVMHATNRFVDLVDEGYDLGLRGHIGPLADTGLVQRPVGPVPWYLVGAPGYLAAHGTPATPGDLAAHTGLLLGGATARAIWSFRRGPALEQIPFTPRLRTDDMTSLRSATVAGLGVAMMPGYACRAEIERGELVRLLPEWSTGDWRVTLLMPSRRGQLAAVRALADFLVAEFPPRVAD